MDYLVQVDVVKCFDSIDHRLLLEHLSKLLGTDNAPLIDLINCFLKTPILDKKGNDYSNSEVGLPQGSPISPSIIPASTRLLVYYQLGASLHKPFNKGRSKT
jgi:retron-type reverse transcriptase